jgi:hypothetical protein
MKSNLEDIQNSYILFKIEVSEKYKSYYSIFYLQDSLESIVDTKIELLSLDTLVYFFITYDGYLYSLENS